MSKSGTKTQILDSAEVLFASRGFTATSLRKIVSAASVNLAAVNYHFSSKEGLITAVLERRIKPLNEERFRRLDALESEHAGGALPLKEVLEALVGPALRLSRDPNLGGAIFLRLLGRAYVEPDERWQKRLNEMFGETAKRFTAALRRALPTLPDRDLFWRIHFSIGAMAHTMCDSARVNMISNGICDPGDVDEIVTQLVAFLTAGMEGASTR